ncbi:hypothetical protein MLD38_018887 [Melastoma candidum]|uniref:Uncharacterized protein n=1 Tax=Melastoma candidum TaxID=119954 RepID=A0ACB9QUM2_9MYRT|nr:hypothetical protein MLD38_018887 [Melastoma candidum]
METSIVLCSPKSNSSQNIKGCSVGIPFLEDPATGEPGTESFAPFSDQLFSLKNVGLKNELLSFFDPYCST